MESPVLHIEEQRAQKVENSDRSNEFALAAQTYGRRPLASIAVLIMALAGCLALSRSTLTYCSPLAHTLVEGYSVIAGICIVYCLWVQYNVTRERRFLLATVAFSGLSLGILAHGTLSLLPGSSDLRIHTLGTSFLLGWQIVSALLLISAARDGSVSDAQTYRKLGKRTLGASLLLSVCVMTAYVVFDPRWLHLRQILPPAAWQTLGDMLKDLVSPRSLQLASIGVTTLALIHHLGSFAEREDEYSRRVIPFLSLALVSYVASLTSAVEFTAIWWASHGAMICALMILLTELGMQFGSSYADAQARIRHMEAVHFMTSRLTNTLDLRVVLLALVSDTASMLSAKFASVMLADESGQALTTEVTYGLSDSPLRPRQPQSVEGTGRPAFFAGHTARAFREKRVCMVEDVYADVEFIPWKVLARHDGYAVSVPLIYHDLALGVLNLFFEKHVSLNDERIKLFQTLASSAAVAIVNAQLYDRTLQAEAEENEAPFTLRLVS